MKIIYKISKDFKDIYCKLGVHDWYYKTESFRVKKPDNNNFYLNITRGLRICKNCYKIQHSGVGYNSNQWFNEDEVNTNKRRTLVRKIKLDKLQKRLK